MANITALKMRYGSPPQTDRLGWSQHTICHSWDLLATALRIFVFARKALKPGQGLHALRRGEDVYDNKLNPNGRGSYIRLKSVPLNY